MGFQLRLQDRIAIANRNYHLANLVQLVRFAACSSLEEQIKITAYRNDLSPLNLEHEPPVKLESIFFPTSMHTCSKTLAEIKAKVANLGQRLGKFVQKEELYILTIFFVLLDQTGYVNFDQLQRSMHHFLLGAIQNFTDGIQDPQLAFGAFYRDLLDLSKTMSFVSDDFTTSSA